MESDELSGTAAKPTPTRVDSVSATYDPTGEVTAFRRAARVLQTRVREASGSPVGTYLGRPNGAVFDETWQRSNPGANFLNSPTILQAVHERIGAPQHNQTLHTDRLWRHLLSSMPMCFNLFGELTYDLARLSSVGSVLFGVTAPGTGVQFEWSPDRLSVGYTGDRTAFDVALTFGSSEAETLIGVETKYHEWAEPEAAPPPSRLPRYEEIVRAGVDGRQVFPDDWREHILGKPVQQIWRDHILLLSLLQHDSHRWIGGKYALVYPEGNPSFRDAATKYQKALVFGRQEPTFLPLTIEQVLGAGVLTPETEAKFRSRYFGPEG